MSTPSHASNDLSDGFLWFPEILAPSTPFGKNDPSCIQWKKQMAPGLRHVYLEVEFHRCSHGYQSFHQIAWMHHYF